MQIRAILKSLFLSYSVTGACLLLLAFLLFQFDLGELPVTAGIVAIYVLSCFFGGFLAGKLLRKDRYLWGILTGLAYFILLLAVSCAVEGGWTMSWRHLFTTFCMCIGGGALGGMLS
jgi:putative membrane protein (TIGR04086 family)